MNLVYCFFLGVISAAVWLIAVRLGEIASELRRMNLTASLKITLNGEVLKGTSK